jgi:lysophospholipase L1-like esterase
MIRYILILLLLVGGFVLFEGIFVAFNGTKVPAPNIPREAQMFGEGQDLNYAVLGDSTAISQGGIYEEGIAVSTAKQLAPNQRVVLRNFGVSGARTKDVLQDQLPKVSAVFRPDVVLIAVGANDVTHLTRSGSVRGSLQAIITQLKEQNPNVKIILTGAPDMGAVPRFPQPLRWLAGVRTKQINKVFTEADQQENVSLAPIATSTGPIFQKNPSLFAPDKFHPNTAGYKIWVPVLNESLTHVR